MCQSIIYNLRFGNQKDLSDDEIWAVCSQLGIGHLRQDAGDGCGFNGLMPVHLYMGSKTAASVHLPLSDFVITRLHAVLPIGNCFVEYR